MNAIEIEKAISDLAAQPFDRAEFPFAFLEAFGRKANTLKQLRAGTTNASDLPGGVLQRNNIHIATCDPGTVDETLKAVRESPKTSAAKAKFILATDGEDIQAEDLVHGESIACRYTELPDRFGSFLPLAGITTVKQIRENSFDIRATRKLNDLYVELLEENPDWATAERRPDMNHFMARLIFCFFAEDTDIFNGEGLFTSTVERFSERDGSNTHEIISNIFRAMDTPTRHEGKLDDRHRKAANIPPHADAFPYVNGALFSGNIEVPRFNQRARILLAHIGGLNWKQINPDIFGSMIQAVADDEERGALGMHYTSVPNILKVLNPLFLDDLRQQLEEAGDNARKLLNLRNRISKIRVFDPACGSGNFLVIAYKQMREIEAEINKRRGESERDSDIPLTNFRGIELRDFPAEIARLALIIAEFQCDVLYRGQKEALADFLPLDSQNWITCGNALRLDWLSICPPTGTGVKHYADDLFHSPLEQAQIDFENEGGETYICGNPPYLGNKLQSKEQKEDLENIFAGRLEGWRSLDYVAGWLFKATQFAKATTAVSAFVTTNSICQGQQVPILWPSIFASGAQIPFAHTSFKWSNLASHNAGVIVVIVGLSSDCSKRRRLFYVDESGQTHERVCDNINPYLVAAPTLVIEGCRHSLLPGAPMMFGNMPRDGGNLLLDLSEKRRLEGQDDIFSSFTRRFVGSEDFIQGKVRYCLWIDDESSTFAAQSREISRRLAAVQDMREASKASSTRDFARRSYRFVQIQGEAQRSAIIVPRHSSERREYLPVGLLGADSIIADSAFAIYDAPIWALSIIASRMHLVWISAVCGKLKTDYRYSNTLGWNTFPLPKLTEKQKADLSETANEILLARERYYPATVGEMYDPEKMDQLFPALRQAHDRNDDVFERAFIGRRFKNDTERLELMFNRYRPMSSDPKDREEAA